MVIYEVIFRLPPPRRAVLKDYAFQPELYKPPEDTPDDLWNLLCECVLTPLISSFQETQRPLTRTFTGTTRPIKETYFPANIKRLG